MDKNIKNQIKEKSLSDFITSLPYLESIFRPIYKSLGNNGDKAELYQAINKVLVPPQKENTIRAWCSNLLRISERNRDFHIKLILIKTIEQLQKRQIRFNNETEDHIAKLKELVNSLDHEQKN